MHAGWGLPATAATLLGEAWGRLAELVRNIPSVRVLNVGGGLGWRQRAEDQPLTPESWGRLLRDKLAQMGELREGDLLALFPASAYGASVASDHCVRGFARELLV
jgi:diaminopimelate decarboxylase